ncbi:MAG: hypothetical protein ACREOZ_01640 [Gloeomargaritales cyanobacterium]
MLPSETLLAQRPFFALQMRWSSRGGEMRCKAAWGAGRARRDGGARDPHCFVLFAPKKFIEETMKDATGGHMLLLKNIS